MVTITVAKTKAELRAFVKFPFQLFANSPNWVPPLIKEELDNFNPNKNPAFKTAKTWFLLAFKDNILVGRTLVIINLLEVENQGVKKIRFGYTDFIDEPDVSQALFNKIAQLGKEHNLDHMEGPMGFSNLDKVGVLIEGFNQTGNMATWYNYDYYQEHYLRFGMTQSKEYLEHIMHIDQADPSMFTRLANLIKERYNVHLYAATTKEELRPKIDEILALLDYSYKDLESYTPITVAQREAIKKKFITFVKPNYIKLVQNQEGKIIGFAVVLPSYATALQKARGKLFPFGIFYLLQAKKKHDKVLFYLIGVHPEYQKKGIPAILFDAYFQTFSKTGVKTGYRMPALADNQAIMQVWKSIGTQVNKRRVTFKKKL